MSAVRSSARSLGTTNNVHVQTENPNRFGFREARVLREDMQVHPAPDCSPGAQRRQRRGCQSWVTPPRSPPGKGTHHLTRAPPRAEVCGASAICHNPHPQGKSPTLPWKHTQSPNSCGVVTTCTETLEDAEKQRQLSEKWCLVCKSVHYVH